MTLPIALIELILSSDAADEPPRSRSTTRPMAEIDLKALLRTAPEEGPAPRRPSDATTSVDDWRPLSPVRPNPWLRMIDGDPPRLTRPPGPPKMRGPGGHPWAKR
ncbi:MAG: hypothetical protein MZU95_06990 [Desulfomicrobium escambiense]|nr:hypothetical protein [Desulfomicrobium escambiense]